MNSENIDKDAQTELTTAEVGRKIKHPGKCQKCNSWKNKKVKPSRCERCYTLQKAADEARMLAVNGQLPSAARIGKI